MYSISYMNSAHSFEGCRGLLYFEDEVRTKTSELPIPCCRGDERGTEPDFEVADCIWLDPS